MRLIYIPKYLFITYILLFSQLLPGQEIDDAPIMLAAQSDGQGIMLRWLYNDISTWKYAKSQGLRIFRIDYSEDGNVKSTVDQFTSRVELEPNYFPLEESSWPTAYPDNDLADAARQLIYSDEELVVEIVGDTTFADAVEATQLDENRMFFLQFIADQDFSMAKSMAMGFMDMTVSANKQYLYYVTIDDTSVAPMDRVSASTLVSLSDVPSLPQPSDMMAMSKGKNIMVGWKISDLLESYTSFDIFRSRDSVNFDQINELPYVFGADNLETRETAFYTDSVTQYGITYFYKIQGKNPFGIMGPMSEITSVLARPQKMSLQLFISDPIALSETTILTWGGLDDIYADSLSGFNLYSSSSISGPFDQVNSELINPLIRQYEDPDPQSEAYYILEAVDLYGNIYQSPPKFIQSADNNPPDLPQELKGKALSGDRVELSWTANDDPDLSGYRLYRCFTPNGTFALIGGGTIQGSTYVDLLDETVITDSIYYRIEAYDVRSNTSGFSERIAVLRDDNTPPAPPSLYKAQPLPQGVSLAWRYSGSTDVVYHILRRKPSTTSDWQELLRIAPYQQKEFEVLDTTSLTATCWIDTASLDTRGYDYQISAYDEQGNASSSDVVSIRPHDSGERGIIESFDVDGSCDQNDNCTIDLSWTYDIDNTVEGFTIYRSRKGSEMKQYKTLKLDYFFNTVDVPIGPANFVYTDEEVDSEVRYIYKVVARHGSDRHSDASPLLTITL